MKKLLLILLIFPLFVACGDDDEKYSADDLAGTIWKTEDKGFNVSTLNFISDTKCEYSDSNSEASKITVDYKYNHPTIVFEPAIFGKSETWKRDGDKIIISWGITFYKQK